MSVRNSAENIKTTEPPVINRLAVRSLVIVDEAGREVAFLGLSGGVARLLLKGERQACCIVTPDGLATFDEDYHSRLEMVTAYGFPDEVEDEITAEPLAV